MTRRRIAILSGTIAALLGATPAFAKRAAPAEVPPVVIDGVRYQAPHFDNPCGQNGGCVVASDVTTGARLWWAKVYCVTYDPALETDVQDVFITSLAAGNGALLVTNEKEHHFSVDPKTHAVSGDLQGCERSGLASDVASGCAYGRARPAGPAIWILAVSLLAWRRRRPDGRR